MRRLRERWGACTSRGIADQLPLTSGMCKAMELSGLPSRSLDAQCWAAPALAPLPPCPPALQLLQQVLGYCTARELGALEATCSYFIKSGLTDRIAKHFLKEIPRAKGLKPDIRQVGSDAQPARYTGTGDRGLCC